MAIDFSKFDEAVNLDELKTGVEKAAQNSGGEYPEVPHGTYVIKVEKLELTESKKHQPMLSCWMKIVDGEFKGQRLFMNQVCNRDFQIHLAKEFLRSLDSGIDVVFDSYVQFADMIMDIAEAIESLEYEVIYGEKKGFNTFEITEVYDG